jgi:hypothetical protein
LALGVAGIAHAVDGVVEINQASAMTGGVTSSDTPGFPVTLDTGGSYRLTGDLDAGGGGGVVITADYVTLDLNGFRVSNATTGVATSTLSINNITVRNGTVSDTTNRGVDVGGLNGRIENVRVVAAGSSAGAPAISAGDNCHVTDNVVVDAKFRGISVGSACTVARNVVRGTANQGRGVMTGSGSTIVENTIVGSAGDGIYTEGATVARNTVTGNGGAGILVIATGAFHSSGVFGNVVADNGSYGLSVGNLQWAAAGQNVFWNNNSGNANPQTAGAVVEVGSNQCATDATCP